MESSLSLCLCLSVSLYLSLSLSVFVCIKNLHRYEIHQRNFCNKMRVAFGVRSAATENAMSAMA